MFYRNYELIYSKHIAINECMLYIPVKGGPLSVINILRLVLLVGLFSGANMCVKAFVSWLPGCHCFGWMGKGNELYRSCIPSCWMAPNIPLSSIGLLGVCAIPTMGQAAWLTDTRGSCRGSAGRVLKCCMIWSTLKSDTPCCSRHKNKTNLYWYIYMIYNPDIA